MAKGKLSSTEQKVLKPKVRKVSQGDIIEGKNAEEKILSIKKSEQN